MPYFQVAAEPAGIPNPGAPDRPRLASYVIANKRPFPTPDEASAAILEETHYPNALMYVVEAETSREATRLVSSLGRDGDTDRRVHLIRGPC